MRVELDPLSQEDLFLVMTAPPDSVVREYQALLKMDGVDLRFSEPALRAIAQFCIRRKTGARSLRTFIEEICHDIMFEAPERKGETITIEPDFALERLERLADGARATTPREERRPSRTTAARRGRFAAACASAICSAIPTGASSRSSSSRPRARPASPRSSARSASWASCRRRSCR